MVDQLLLIAHSIVDSFIHIWPYLLITIPIAVAVQLSGAAKYISRALQARPVAAILLAAFVGAFSPFCSCGVIPVVAALLLSGVPLAPVMTFWIASPSMDPEIFFLSVGTLGWRLAVWRLGAALLISLGAGFITQTMTQKGWLGGGIIRNENSAQVRSRRELLKAGWLRLRNVAAAMPFFGQPSLVAPATATSSLSMADSQSAASYSQPVSGEAQPLPGVGTGLVADAGASATKGNSDAQISSSCAVDDQSSCSSAKAPFHRRLFEETVKATTMVVKYMTLAFLMAALIDLYIPDDWIASLLGRDNPLAVIGAAGIGIPAYTSNLTALPLMEGLLNQGMDPAAALAFLLAGPTTTLPAMAAVWGLTSRRVFALYVSISLVGAIVMGYAFKLLTW